MSSFFSQKPPKNFLTLGVFAGTFWLSVPSFRWETGKITSNPKGKKLCSFFLRILYC